MKTLHRYLYKKLNCLLNYAKCYITLVPLKNFKISVIINVYIFFESYVTWEFFYFRPLFNISNPFPIKNSVNHRKNIECQNSAISPNFLFSKVLRLIHKYFFRIFRFRTSFEIIKRQNQRGKVVGRTQKILFFAFFALFQLIFEQITIFLTFIVMRSVGSERKNYCGSYLLFSGNSGKMVVEMHICTSFSQMRFAPTK